MPYRSFTKIRLTALFAAALFCAACAKHNVKTPEQKTKAPIDYNQTAVLKTITLDLGINASPYDIENLSYGIDEIFGSLGSEMFPDFDYEGLSYNLSPVGAVNTLSKMEINCIAAGNGQHEQHILFCSRFAQQIAKKYKVYK